jgi:hypothetical protein
MVSALRFAGASGVRWFQRTKASAMMIWKSLGRCLNNPERERMTMHFCDVALDSEALVYSNDEGFHASLYRNGLWREHWYETLEKLEVGLRFWRGRGVRIPQSCFDEINKAKS